MKLARTGNYLLGCENWDGLPLKRKQAAKKNLAWWIRSFQGSAFLTFPMQPLRN